MAAGSGTIKAENRLPTGARIGGKKRAGPAHPSSKRDPSTWQEMKND
jgi:hypothetical protein